MKTIHYSDCPICHSKDIGPYLMVKDHSISQEEFPVWQCKSCSFVFTQDVPSPEDIGPYYKSENYISHSDNKEGIVNGLYHYAREIMLGRKFQLVKRLAKGKKLLDIGAGTGYFPDYMQRKGYDVVGVEIDEDARNYGQEKFGVTMHAPDFLHKGAEQNSYDAITLWHVLEHLYTPLDDMKNVHKLLKEKGVLVVAVPNHTSKDAQKYGEHWAAYDVPRHLWHFSPKTMEQLMQKAGFKLIETHHMPMDPFYVSIMSSRYKSGGGLVSGVWNGLRSFAKSSINANLGSSVIYVMKKNN